MSAPDSEPVINVLTAKDLAKLEVLFAVCLTPNDLAVAMQIIKQRHVVPVENVQRAADQLIRMFERKRRAPL